MADENAMNVPGGVKAKILKEISGDHFQSSQSSRTNSLQSWTMGIMALGLLFSSYLIWQMKAEINSSQEEYMALKEDCDDNQREFAIVQKELDLIKSPETRTLVLDGKAFDKDAEVVAFWNANYKYALLDIKNLPAIEKNQCFQIWADKDGKMISRAHFKIARIL